MSDVLILYQISNELPLNYHPTPTGYNAFYLPRKNNGITLSSIKSHIGSSLGHDQFHWRVRIDDRPAANNTHHHDGHTPTSTGAQSTNSYSWWDIQDENARLPIKEATPKELKKMFAPPKKEEASNDVTQEVTKAAKGAMKYMNKAMTKVAGSHTNHHSSSMHGYDDEYGEDDFGMQRIAVICFKVLDMTRMGRNFTGGSGSGSSVRRVVQRRSSAASAQPRVVAHRAPRVTTTPHQQQQQQQRRATPAKSATAPTGNLMDFGSTSSTVATTPQQQQQHHRPLPSRTTATSAIKSTPTGKAHPNETRAEKLKREYAKKNAQSNRVWDEVDQRWVEQSSKNGESAASRSNSSATPNNNNINNVAAGGGVSSVTKSVKGISLSTTNAIGKSANVQAAVHARVAEMQSSQQKDLTELRNREAAKAQSDAEEDVVRQRLEPKLKAWSEEHGQKKQLRALLANLHTILWEGSGWKQVSLADVLDDGKVKRAYHKASRVVHPDKTLGLDAEKKFVAKRVFDALTQAKVAFDEGKR